MLIKFTFAIFMLMAVCWSGPSESCQRYFGSPSSSKSSFDPGKPPPVGPFKGLVDIKTALAKRGINSSIDQDSKRLKIEVGWVNEWKFAEYFGLLNLQFGVGMGFSLSMPDGGFSDTFIYLPHEFAYDALNPRIEDQDLLVFFGRYILWYVYKLGPRLPQRFDGLLSGMEVDLSRGRAEITLKDTSESVENNPLSLRFTAEVGGDVYDMACVVGGSYSKKGPYSNHQEAADALRSALHARFLFLANTLTRFEWIINPHRGARSRQQQILLPKGVREETIYMILDLLEDVNSLMIFEQWNDPDEYDQSNDFDE